MLYLSIRNSNSSSKLYTVQSSKLEINDPTNRNKTRNFDPSMNRQKSKASHMKLMVHSLRSIFTVLLASIWTGAIYAADSPSVSQPNILIILADDFGWGDASCNNADTPLKTPAIDRIANEGIRFTNAQTPSAVCAPTRYGLLTGRYPWRSYLKQRVLSGYCPALITKGRTTIPSYLQSQGYRTAGFGKWHLGMDWTPVEGDPENWKSHWKSRGCKNNDSGWHRD